MVRPRRGVARGHGSYIPRPDDAHVQRRKAAVDMLRAGFSQKDAASVFKVSRYTIRRWRIWYDDQEAQETRFHTALHLRGRKRVLDENDVHQIDLWLQEDLHTTATEIVERLGRKASHSTVCRTIKELGYTIRKDKIGDSPLTAAQIEQTRAFVAKTRNIPWRRRVYFDESFLYANEHQHWGYARDGQRPATALASQAVRFTVYWAITNRGQVHDPIVSAQKANTANFENYVQQTLAPTVPYQSVMFWDRLGRSGRAVNPVSQHYSPTARQVLQQRQVRV